jgi:hypothetical protein
MVILSDKLNPEPFVDVGDIDVVVEGAETERFALEGLSLLLLDGEAEFAEVDGAKVDIVETDSRAPSEDIGDDAVVVAAAAFSAG